MRLQLRRYVGFLANNLGVVMQDLGRDKDAFALYELVLKTIDCDNICALFNEFEMARAGVREAVAHKAEIERQLKAVVDDPQRRYMLWSLSRYYGYIRSPEIFARMGYAWARSGQTGNAIAQVQRAIDFVPSDRQAGLLNMMAAIYASGNQTQKSREVYNQVLEETTAAVTDEEVTEQYPSVNVRHILVKAVAGEDGTFSDEAKAEAKAKAEEILAEFEAGEKTEESFAALAEQYSEDEGSNTNGGLYENVLEGQMVAEFNDFCFAEGRKAGDTGIVYGENGAYAGYHVMYFAGEGDPATNETGRSQIANSKMSEWLQGLADGIEVKEKFFYRLVGKV